MVEHCHSMKMASHLTGLSPHVIRVWEKRYAAITPSRTLTKRRRYSEAEIARLRLLRLVTSQGSPIGSVANLEDQQLLELSMRGMKGLGPGRSPAPPEPPGVSSAKMAFVKALAAIRGLDGAALRSVLDTVAVEFGHQGLLLQIIAPLAVEIGDLWQKGVVTAAHEHFASAIIRDYLMGQGRSFAISESAPNLIVATPSGQIHELGAVIVAAAASNMGWRVTYLGASLPSAEIAGAARQNRALAVALSLVYPDSDPTTEVELAQLRKFLPPEVKILVGGRVAGSYETILQEIGAWQLNSLADLFPALEKSKKRSAKKIWGEVKA